MQNILSTLQKGAVITAIIMQAAAIKLNDPRRQTAGKSAVVADKHQGLTQPQQQLFEFDNRLDIKMVGRLIEQDQVGFENQRCRQQGTTLLAPGKIGRRLIQQQFQTTGELVDPYLQSQLIDPLSLSTLLQKVTHRARPLGRKVLGNVGGVHPLATLYLTCIDGDVAVEQTHQR